MQQVEELVLAQLKAWMAMGNKHAALPTHVPGVSVPLRKCCFCLAWKLLTGQTCHAYVMISYRN